MHILMRAAMAAGLCLWSLTSAYSQMGPGQHQKSFGYQDEQGVFHPASQMVPDTTPAKTDYTGTLKVTITITVKSTLATGSTIVCGADATVISANETTILAAPIGYDEWVYAKATGSGSSYTCTLEIPYSWDLLTPATGISNTMTVGYQVEALGASGALFSTGQGFRLTSGSIVESANIPAVGATTSYTVSATI